jgi:hypothetical protein
MKIRLRVTPADAPAFVVTTNVGVILAWESKYNTHVSVLKDRAGLRDFAFLAYESAKREGHDVGPSFDKWAQTLDAVELAGEDEAVPLDEDRSAG